MGGWYGWRLVCVVALLALGCRVGLAQIGPRYALEVPAPRQGGTAPDGGSIALGPDGRATIRFHGLTVALAGRDGGTGPADLAVLPPGSGGLSASGVPVAVAGSVPLVYAESPAMGQVAEKAGHPMRTWDTLYLRKGQARLRVTAMPGEPGTAATAGFMLEIGTLHATRRIYVSGVALAAGELAALPRRLPGAELVLAPAGQGQVQSQRQGQSQSQSQSQSQGLALLRRAGERDLFVPVAAPGGRYPFTLQRR